LPVRWWTNGGAAATGFGERLPVEMLRLTTDADVVHWVVDEVEELFEEAGSLVRVRKGRQVAADVRLLAELAEAAAATAARAASCELQRAGLV